MPQEVSVVSELLRCPQSRRFRILPVLLSLLGSAGFVLPAQSGPFEVKIENGVRVPMRDGVSLVADIYRPVSGEIFPVLLQRTPYNREGGSSSGRILASHGYIVVFQDTRGRYDSEGEFYPFRNEGEDGYDTVEWAARLPGSNGRVGMFGGSYVGATQMLAAMSRPPHLEAIFPFVTAAEYYEGWTYQGGALMQWFASSWTSGLAENTLDRLTAANRHLKDWSYTLPVEDYPVLQLPTGDELAPYYDDWVRHESNDAYWKRWKISDHYGELNVKSLHSGGWHDIFSGGSLRNYMGLRKEGKSAEIREGQYLLFGPWAHAATSDEGKIGGVVFGRDAVLDMDQATLDWYDFVLKGKENSFTSSKRVRIFILGENAWREESDFPIARAVETKFYLNSKQGANSISGDGELVASVPGESRPDFFEYDPENPVPTIGGRLCCGNDVFPPGPFDQSPNETRRDVLVYSTPPLEQEMEVTGFIRLELYAATTGADTDFTAILADVDPSGNARYLADGIVRARYRNSTEKAEPIEMGTVYRYEIDLWATSNLFKKGHRMRLYVSSSNFPRFNRNSNTGAPVFGSAGMIKADQTVFHSRDYPSALVLPVVPR
jgi:putative CocE/NonD family hydrolase